MQRLKLYKLNILIIILFIGCSKEEEPLNDNETQVYTFQNRQPVGASANAILSDLDYKELKIELAYIKGSKPTEEAINNILSFLQSKIHKPNGISIEQKQISIVQKGTYTLDDITAIEVENREHYNSEQTLSMWMLFIDGESSEGNSNNLILGTAYWNTSFVIWQEVIEFLSDEPFEPSRSLIETTVINHELGHLLGLTNLGSEMVNNHEDGNHPKHCINEDCLMYWAADSSAGINNLFNSSTYPELDSDCVADLRANGGK